MIMILINNVILKKSNILIILLKILNEYWNNKHISRFKIYYKIIINLEEMDFIFFKYNHLQNND